MEQSDKICPRCRKTNIKRFGSFARKGESARIQRFYCRPCMKTFSSTTSSFEYRQRRREINTSLYLSLVSGVSMRRSAMIMGTNYKTVARRLSYFEKICEAHHQTLLTNLKGLKEIHFDDMESSIHTKLKPVSIPLAVSHPRRLILAFDVVSMPAKGPLAAISRKKYGKRADDRYRGWHKVLGASAGLAAANVEVTSDSHTAYPGLIKQHMPLAKHIRTISRRACVVGQGELKRGGHDPLFSLNHTAAMYRANVNRLFRRTWCTSKRIDHLKMHMTLYRSWHNEMILAKEENRKPSYPFAVVS